MVAIVVVVIVVAPYALAIIVDFIARGTVAVVVAIVVVVARNDVAIIVDFVAHGAVVESEPKLGVNKTPWWPFIEITQYVSLLLTVKLELGTIYFSCSGR